MSADNSTQGAEIDRQVDEHLDFLARAIRKHITDEATRAEIDGRLAPLLAGTADRGDDVAALLDCLAVRRLREAVLPLADAWPESIRGNVIVQLVREACDAVARGDTEACAEIRELAKWAGEEAMIAGERFWTCVAGVAEWTLAAAETAMWAARAAENVMWAARWSSRSVEEEAVAEAERLIEELERLHDGEGA